MEGPDMERSDPHSLPIREWCTMNANLRKLGLIKLSHIADFEDSILSHFTPYWKDFKPYVRQLVEAFWPTTYPKPNSMTSEKMLQILKDAIANMKDAEEQLESDSLDTPVSRSFEVLNSKRNRQGQDVALVNKRKKTSQNAMVVQDFGIWKESIMIPDSDAMRGSVDSSASFSTFL
jgi:hypothetical protein